MILLKTLFENRPRLFQLVLSRVKETKRIVDSDVRVVQGLVSEIKTPRTPELILVRDAPLELVTDPKVAYIV